MSSERERNAQLASLHAAAFPSPKGTFAFTYRFDAETGAMAPDFDSLAYTDWAPEPLFPAVMSLAARYPGSINAFYGGLNVASMTQRFAEVGTLPADFGAAIEETYRPFGIRDFYACCATNLAMDRARTRAGRADAERAVAAWRALVEGRWSLLDHFDSDGRRYLVARENEPATRTIRTLTPRERQVALYAAHGHSNKLIGYELGLSEGTVKAHLARAMGKLGFESRSRLASLLASSTSADRASSTTFGTERIEVRSGPVPEPPSGLSPAEAAIFDGILGGADTATLAEARGVSRKTIGNQLSGLYRKLGVASSAELLARYGAPHRPPGE
ncbi:MAG TPA: LuxR C-terminal-related transcriptional regulator [Polyangiaceae bacterium LLY-WYZ-14_1]|nr:LuxR C-terminal-related transcriptional regulator [Polyangiaceae bacterium LLY-WYZ-14_1]